MKILMVNKFLYPNGGSETYIFELADYLIHQGHEVEFFGMYHHKNIVTNRMDTCVNNMEFHTGKLERLVYPFKIIYSTEARKKIREVIKAFEPDLIHLNNFNFQITPSILFEIKRYKIPVVMTLHDFQLICPNHMLYIEHEGKVCNACENGSYVPCIKNNCIHRSKIKSLLGAFESWLYHSLKAYERHIDLLISPSRFLVDKMQEFGQKTEKIRVLSNFISSTHSITYIKENYVLYFGRLTKQKGILTLLEACKRLPHIPFKFAGTGDMEEKLIGIKNVEFLGFVNGEALKELIGKARFSVYPSEWYENCPLSILESQALGTPVLASNIGGIPELIQQDDDGVLFEAGNVSELTANIKNLYENEERLRIFSQNCQNKMKNYQINKYYDDLLGIYEEAKLNYSSV